MASDRGWIYALGGVSVALLLAGLAAGASVAGETAAIVATYPKCSPALAREIVRVARQLGTEPFWLADLIWFESGLTFDPAERNEIGATGLIQFTPKTAKRLGTTTDALAQLSGVEQMAWVERYLDLVRRGQWADDPRPVALDTFQALAMSVFYLPGRDKPESYPLPDWARDANKGIEVVGDYMRLVKRSGKLWSLVNGGAT